MFGWRVVPMLDPLLLSWVWLFVLAKPRGLELTTLIPPKPAGRARFGFCSYPTMDDGWIRFYTFREQNTNASRMENQFAKYLEGVWRKKIISDGSFFGQSLNEINNPISLYFTGALSFSQPKNNPAQKFQTPL